MTCLECRAQASDKIAIDIVCFWKGADMIHFNSNTGELVVILLSGLCFLGLGLLLMLFPNRGAQLLARIVAAYQKAFGLSDQELDSGTLPLQRFVESSSASRFAEVGSKTPEEFPGVVAYVRAFGVVLVAMLGLSLCLVLGLFLLSLILNPSQ